MRWVLIHLAQPQVFRLKSLLNSCPGVIDDSPHQSLQNPSSPRVPLEHCLWTCSHGTRSYMFETCDSASNMCRPSSFLSFVNYCLMRRNGKNIDQRLTFLLRGRHLSCDKHRKTVVLRSFFQSSSAKGRLITKKETG